MIKEKTYLVTVKNLVLKASVGIFPKEKKKSKKFVLIYLLHQKIT
tara:strand:+ start:2376 stop:2510 length:135 start_codon:yes stop_codon:yes gene_type:complete